MTRLNNELSIDDLDMISGGEEKPSIVHEIVHRAGAGATGTSTLPWSNPSGSYTGWARALGPIHF